MDVASYEAGKVGKLYRNDCVRYDILAVFTVWHSANLF